MLNIEQYEQILNKFKYNNDDELTGLIIIQNTLDLLDKKLYKDYVKEVYKYIIEKLEDHKKKEEENRNRSTQKILELQNAIEKNNKYINQMTYRIEDIKQMDIFK